MTHTLVGKGLTPSAASTAVLTSDHLGVLKIIMV